jgi:hypothetical protein
MYLRLHLLIRTRTEIIFGHPNTKEVLVMTTKEWQEYGEPHTVLVPND